jgi:hypothetical protein
MDIRIESAARRARALWIPLLLVGMIAAAVLWLGGCSEATAPAKDDGNVLDPAVGTFALKDIVVPGPGGVPVLLRLEGAEMLADPAAGTVSLSVQVRNLSGEAVSPPLIVWLGDIRPAGVTPLNADLTLPAGVVDAAGAVTDSTVFGYDYTALLGGAPLAPGAATPLKTWTFSDPTLVAFSFAARVECGAFAGQARLGGRCFVDLDRNGRPDDGEPPFTAGGVQVTGPDGVASWSMPAPDGRWEAPVGEPGLYEVQFQSLSMSPLPVELTTPNPLSVVITVTADGTLQSYLDAHFGVASGWLPPPVTGTVGFTDTSPDSLHLAPWMLFEARATGPLLELAVGFSGCQPEHAFSLWMSGEFMESMPPRASLTLVHETQEACDAAFSDNLRFDLMPLYLRYREQYGTGPLVLVLHGPNGFTQELELATVPPDSLFPVGVGAAR